MTTTIRNRHRHAPPRTISWGAAGRDRRGGFTLVEVMVASTLGTLVLAGILSSFLMIGRTQTSLFHYSGLEQAARKGLERFSQDTRMAKQIAWTNNAHVTLEIPRISESTTDPVVYYWDTTPGSPNYHCFMRTGPDPITGVTTTEPLIRHVEAFEFGRWMVGATGEATNDFATKQLQIRLTLSRADSTLVTATNLVVSARYILRNKY